MVSQTLHGGGNCSHQSALYLYTNIPPRSLLSPLWLLESFPCMSTSLSGLLGSFSLYWADLCEPSCVSRAVWADLCEPSCVSRAVWAGILFVAFHKSRWLPGIHLVFRTLSTFECFIKLWAIAKGRFSQVALWANWHILSLTVPSAATSCQSILDSLSYFLLTRY